MYHTDVPLLPASKLPFLDKCKSTDCPAPLVCLRLPSTARGSDGSERREKCVCPKIDVKKSSLWCPPAKSYADVVCGTDGVAYPSECHLRLAACVAGSPDVVKVATRGPCGSSVGAGQIEDQGWVTTSTVATTVTGGGYYPLTDDGGSSPSAGGSFSVDAKPSTTPGTFLTGIYLWVFIRQRLY